MIFSEEIIPVPQNPENFNKEINQEDIEFKAPYAIANLTPCGNGFVVGITTGGEPSPLSFQYEIRISGTSTVEDAGMISDGGSTNWVLDPCTIYDFEFWGYSGCSTCSETQSISSDGCGGIFLC